MKLPDDVAERAAQALSRPLRSHELADAVWPDRADRPLAAKSRAGHAAGRDLVERGWAVQNADGTYLAASLTDPTRQDAQPLDGELVVDPATGTVTRVVRHVLGHTQISPQTPQQPTADGLLTVENGQVIRVRKEVIGPVASHAQQQVPEQSSLYVQWQAWWAAKRPEMTAIMTLIFQTAFFSPDATTRWRKGEEARVRFLRLSTEVNAWARALGTPELPFVAQLAVPTPPPVQTPAWSPWNAPAPSYGW